MAGTNGPVEGNDAEVLGAIERATGAIAAAVGPAVVGIGAGWGVGTGVVVGDGVVVTNAHNVRGGDVEVRFVDGRVATGSVQAADIDGDLAVVRVETGGVAAPEWTDTAPDVGAFVFALANPGGRGLRVTSGQVSARAQAFRGPRGRRIAGGLEHSAPLPPGSSGGPVLDRTGRLVGINTHRIGKGFYLAQPADEALRSRIDSLARGELKERPRLGVGVAPSHVARKLREAVGLPPRDGLLVRAVADGSPAAASGIAVGDLIAEVAGTPVANTDQLFEALDDAGDSVALLVVRGADELDVVVRFDGTATDSGAA